MSVVINELSKSCTFSDKLSEGIAKHCFSPEASFFKEFFQFYIRIFIIPDFCYFQNFRTICGGAAGGF